MAASGIVTTAPTAVSYQNQNQYWAPKLEHNRLRDEANVARLHALGWRVLVVWECETGDGRKLKERLIKFLGSKE
jgi:DNA mismatch endonuclease (patch repair protein)